MKQIPLTDELKTRLRAAFGTDATIDNLVVFEATAANLLPLRKSSGIYKGARFAESMFKEMVTAVQGESVPLHVMHDTYVLPVGRVFDAVSLGEELRIQFALNADTKPEIIADLNAGMLDQVSVGVLPQRLLCSECGWDYMGDGATSENWWELTCGNGHEIGVDGTHVRLAGLASWMETSIVPKGAVNGAKIVGPSQSVFDANPGAQRLAASEKVPGAKLMCAAVVDLSTTPKKEPAPMADKDTPSNVVTFDVNKMVADLSAATSTAAEATAKLTAAEAEIVTLKASLAAKEAVNPEEFTAAVAALSEIAKKSAIALGEQTPTIPEGVANIVTYLNDKQAKLTAMIPATPRSQGADHKLAATASAGGAAFQTRPR